MRLAIVGSGMIVREFLSIAPEVAGLQLAAICGRPESRAKLEQLSSTYGIDRVHVDYDQCLADPAVDTVYVALPNSLHFAAARQALLAGKHVICEKPFVLRAAELATLRELATRRGLVLVEAISNQYLANYRYLQDHLPELGDLRVVQCEYSQFSSRYPAFRDGEVRPAFDPEMGGGALMDIGIYALHLVAGLLGRPRSVRYTANVSRGVDTSGVVVLEYEGAIAVCVCAKDSPGPSRTKLQGTEGTIVMPAPPNTCDRLVVTRRGEPAQDVDRSVHPHRMVEEFRAFEAMIREVDLAERDRRLDHSELVLELATTALATAGIRLGPQAGG